MAKSKKELQALLNDPEAKWFFYNLYKKESHKQNGVLNIGGHNQSSGDSTAFGAGQFIGDTRNAILKKYGVDAWSKDLEEQKLASLALLDDNNVLDDYLAGNYAVLNKKNPNGTTSMWAAFAGEDPLTGTTAAEVMFSTKPANWEQDYADLETNAVYDPESSWATIDPTIQKEKAKWFKNKYSINNPSTLTNDANKLPITADAEETRTVNTQGVPTEQQARSDERYSVDVSKRPETRKNALLKFREEAIEMLNRKPGSTKLGGDGTGGLKEVAAWMKEFEQLIKDNPVSAVLSDNWDGTKEALMASEDFFDNKATSISDEVAETFFESKSGMGYVELSKLSDKLYNDEYFFDDNPANNRLNEISDVEVNQPELNITRTNSDGSYNVKLSDGRSIKLKDNPRNQILPFNNNYQNPEQPVKSKGLEAIPNESNVELIDTREQLKKDYEDSPKRFKPKRTTLDSDKENSRNRMMKGAEMALTGLKAAAGITSLSKAMQDPEIDIPEISPLLMEAVSKQRQISESGLTSSEKNAAMQGMNDAYAGAMKNVLGASGGQRGLFLANQGTVDAQRIQGLNQLAAQDAALHRQNLQQYNQLAQSVGSMKLQRDMTAEQMKQSAIAQNKQVMSGIGANLLSDSLSDVSWYLNPNRDLIEKGQRASYEKFLDLQNQGAKFDDYEYDVTGNNLRKKEKE